MTCLQQKNHAVRNRLIAAHRAQDWDAARLAGAIWERIKRLRHCPHPGCGAALSSQDKIKRGTGPKYCQTHWRLHRNILTMPK